MALKAPALKAPALKAPTLKAPVLKAPALKVPRSIAVKAPKSGGIARRNLTRDELTKLKFEE